MGCGCGTETKLRYAAAETNKACFGPVIGKNLSGKKYNAGARWITRYLNTKAGKIPVVSTRLSRKDVVDGWKVRWGIRRMDYRVDPGLYAVGAADENSPVLVSANYKLTFDSVRKELSGSACWVLVLDTKGVNVWCAAGKGTFGTAELAARIFASGLGSVIAHRRLILPQLGAVGVSAAEVSKLTGFAVTYGPVRAGDIKAFLANGRKKNEAMRTVYFPLAERMAVAPMELVHSLKYLAILSLFIAVMSVVEHRALTLDSLLSCIPFLGAVLAGSLLFPALLPFLPFRSFALKGYVLGLLFTAAVAAIGYAGPLSAAADFLILPPLVSFIALNFTGASTYTSLTGTKLEVAISLPLLAISAVAGIAVKTWFFVSTIV
jgi:hypothetical protein